MVLIALFTIGLYKWSLKYQLRNWSPGSIAIWHCEYFFLILIMDIDSFVTVLILRYSCCNEKYVIRLQECMRHDLLRKKIH